MDYKIVRGGRVVHGLFLKGKIVRGDFQPGNKLL